MATHVEINSQSELSLRFGFVFSDLYSQQGLERLDNVFLEYLEKIDVTLATDLRAVRCNHSESSQQESALIIALSPHLDDFLGELFGIRVEVNALSARHHELAPLYNCKRQFVQRKAAHEIDAGAAAKIDGWSLELQLEALFGARFSELAFAQHVALWQQNENKYFAALEVATRYAAWSVYSADGNERHRSGVLFKVPAKLDFERLVDLVIEENEDYLSYRVSERHLTHRVGFKLTDIGTDLVGALDQAHYCIFCHHQGRDSCSKGLVQKEKNGETSFKKNLLGATLAGCPLEEKISEFHEVKTLGHALAGLAVITIDNPMVAATGHRICNDCMKSCIYQKQEPVNIPQAETRTLKDVLELPWGFEIYSLLTRWNPLNFARPYPKRTSGRRVLVVGMGPAGFTLAHHLMNDGHLVVAIDGLKIEPLPPHHSGVDANGARKPFQPILNVNTLFDALDERVMAGFGGVAEYGITVRWDKNYLKLIRLLLARRDQFALFGGVRFGGTITVDDAFARGFDHIALAIGAGRPTVLDMPNGLARGVRAASDFLMALQLTGAAKENSLANLQIRLPVVVIGGGLTAIDTATEALAYYPVQVEKFLKRYEILVAENGKASVNERWSEEEKTIATEYLEHGNAIRAERARAAIEKRDPNIITLIKSWGGVTIAYRKRLLDSPSYTLNHEEVEKALQQGITFAEKLSPVSVEIDKYGHTRALQMVSQMCGEDGSWYEVGNIEFPARTVIVAAGTQPNTVLAREDPSNFALDGRYFQACDESGNAVQPEFATGKPKQARVLLSKRADGRFLSFFGDVHPSYFGNVVKAMAAAKQGYPVVSHVLSGIAPASALTDAEFIDHLNVELRATIHKVTRLTPNIVEIVVKAPAAARRFEPGQFYRLQNFESQCVTINDTRLAMEGLALTGAWVDKNAGLVSTIVLEMGGSADLCFLLEPGEQVVLMGPTGSATEIPSGETVALVGGGLGNAVLFSIGGALRQNNNKVLYFAAYKKIIDRYKTDEIEAAADVVIWCSDEAPGFQPRRAQDKAFVGNVVDAMACYAQDGLGMQSVPLFTVDRFIVIGSDRMMSAVAGARHGVLKAFLNPRHFAIGSINSPMQCMMKEICAQCLQLHTDPETGKSRYVFSCFNQDQPLDQVNFACLDARLRQNSVQEKLTAQWIHRCLVHLQRRKAAA